MGTNQSCMQLSESYGEEVRCKKMRRLGENLSRSWWHRGFYCSLQCRCCMKTPFSCCSWKRECAIAAPMWRYSFTFSRRLPNAQ